MEQEPIVVSKQQHKDWLDHPITDAYFKKVKWAEEAHKEMWAQGAFTDASFEGTAQQNSKNIGKATAYSEMMNEAVEGHFLTFVEDTEEAE